MSGHPNTVAFSAGAVCCPDEASARRHRDRATWDDWPPEIEVGPDGRLKWVDHVRRWTR